MQSENTDPNAQVVGIDPKQASHVPVQGVPSSLVSAIAGLKDGEVELADDLVLVRAGPTTYHPLKSCRDLAGEDMVIISTLQAVPNSTEAEDIVRCMLSHLLVRQTRSACGSASNASSAATSSALLSSCPASYKQLIETRLFTALPCHRARLLLASIIDAKSSAAGTAAVAMPTVLVACHSSADGMQAPASAASHAGGLCFLGHKVDNENSTYKTLTVREDDLSGYAAVPTASGLAEMLVTKFTRLGHSTTSGGHTNSSSAQAHSRVVARGRALYSVYGGKGGGGEGLVQHSVANDCAGGCAQLATEWNANDHRPKEMGAPPPLVCSSSLFVGGTCSLSQVSFDLRADLDRLRQQVKYLRGYKPDASDHLSQEASAECEEQLESLLYSSNHLAAVVERSDTNLSIPAEEDPEETISTIGLEALATSTASADPSKPHRLRSNMDFSEQLWEIVSRMPTPAEMCQALTRAFKAVEQGQLFPVIASSNSTVIGDVIRKGVDITQAARYKRQEMVSEESIKVWKETAESTATQATEKALPACLELGVFKISRDLLHWFELQVGVSSAELRHFLEGVHNLNGGVETVHSLGLVVDVVDVITLAMTCGAPWSAMRALAEAALHAFLPPAPGQNPRHSLLSSVISVPLLESIPPVTRGRLVNLFWELHLSNQGSASSQSWIMVKRNEFQARPVTACEGSGPNSNHLSLTGDLLQHARDVSKKALTDGNPALVPQVMKCITGVDSLAKLIQLGQEEAAAAKASAGDQEKDEKEQIGMGKSPIPPKDMILPFLDRPSL